MPYEKYHAWRVSHSLALEVYQATEQWPRSELYGLTAQTRRAALSVPTNIAEGAAKLGPESSADTWTSLLARFRSFPTCCASAMIVTCSEPRSGNG
ncbi:MAG: four helix bundle protein [Gemmatimonadales bacterium]